MKRSCLVNDEPFLYECSCSLVFRHFEDMERHHQIKGTSLVCNNCYEFSACDHESHMSQRERIPFMSSYRERQARWSHDYSAIRATNTPELGRSRGRRGSRKAFYEHD